jgi:methylglutaconyl-CoA hydratase
MRKVNMTDAVVTSHIDARGVATVTLNNPDKHNAFDDVIIAQLTAAFTAIAADENVRVMLLTSLGRSFSAGADLNWMKRMCSYTYEENLRDAKALALMLKTLNFMPQPTIARVQGAAFGGAVGLVSCCDMAVGGPRALFSLSEVKIGLIPATISPYVVAAIGSRASRRYFTTAERFDGQTALALGLLSELVAEDELDKRIGDLVEQLLSNSPAAVAQAKTLVFDVAEQAINNDASSDALIAMTSARIAAIRVSDEGQEGLNAFIQKRPATWTQAAKSGEENNDV